jgi:HSP20 family molecular chaperone IbpA
MLKKKSFFERLTGSIRLADETEEKEVVMPPAHTLNLSGKNSKKDSGSISVQGEEEVEEEVGQLTVDVYHTASEIIIQSMVAGVQPDNLSIVITRDMVTIKGKREEVRGIDKDNYFVKELYWGSFARTIDLPVEIEPEESEAIEKHGLLIIKLPKINKDKKTSLKVKSI